MWSFKSNGVRGAGSFPKFSKLRATTLTPISSTSPRSTSRRETTYDDLTTILSADSFRVGIRPRAPFAWRSSRRSFAEPWAWANHATDSGRGGKRKPAVPVLARRAERDRRRRFPRDESHQGELLQPHQGKHPRGPARVPGS